jgi:NADPH:quinone reductase-like Zn-dependent oxidoreductase
MTDSVKMKAFTRTKYGPPETLQQNEVARPTPTDNEVLVRIRATSINKADLYDLDPSLFLRLFLMRSLKPTTPMVLSDISGTVESVGKDVKQFHKGDEVFGDAHWGLAEYACAREDRLAPKPANITFEEGAAVPVAALTALQCLRDKAKVSPGKTVLIYGANGGVGTFAVQIAKALGGEVTAVTSPGNLDAARSMGADHVIDYTKEDFTKNGQKYDVIMAANGRRSIFAFTGALRPGGTFALIGSNKIIRSLLEFFILGPVVSRTRGIKRKWMIAKLNQPDLLALRDLLESGKVKPKIARSYPFDRAVEAYSYLEEGHAPGKVVISLNPPSSG